jgi:hypothetical protein
MASIAEIKVGRRVRARGCPGLGVGTVVVVETALVNEDGSTIPHVGFVRALVDFGPDDFDGHALIEAFSSRELILVEGK